LHFGPKPTINCRGQNNTPLRFKMNVV